MEIEKYTRTPFTVDAVQVTKENMEEVREWCDGLIRENDDETFIQVRVARPMNVKQTRAFATDWVLKAGRGFKVYTDKAFRKNFIAVVSENDAVHIEIDPVNN